jgi:transcriptional regulator with XRE-family HTH domain
MSKVTYRKLESIRYYRGYGLTQAEVAEKVGLSRQVVGYWLKKMRETAVLFDKNGMSWGDILIAIAPDCNVTILIDPIDADIEQVVEVV